MTSSTITEPDDHLETIYARGYPINKHSTVVIAPTARDIPRTLRLVESVKKVPKLANVKLPSESRNAFTNNTISGATMNTSINRT